MLIGGWSKMISVTGPRAVTSKRSSTTGLEVEQVTDRSLERYASASPWTYEYVQSRAGGEQTGDGIRHRRAREPRNPEAARPTRAIFCRQPVARSVVTRERA